LIWKEKNHLQFSFSFSFFLRLPPVGHLWHAGSTRATVARFEKGIHLDFED
jgi:hypothetical protein